VRTCTPLYIVRVYDRWASRTPTTAAPMAASDSGSVAVANAGAVGAGAAPVRSARAASSARATVLAIRGSLARPPATTTQSGEGSSLSENAASRTSRSASSQMGCSSCSYLVWTED